MSRVASNIPLPRYNNGVGYSTKSMLSRSISNVGSINGNSGERRVFNVRTGVPIPIQKETVHACPLCIDAYKDPRVLPCTHTYCFNCIRDKLIKNNRLTCPKCHHQVHPFDETNLSDLPPNLILSQEWRIAARPVAPTFTPKKPITYQPASSSSQAAIPLPSMTQESDKRKSIVTENNDHEISTNGIASIVNAFNRPSGVGENGHRSSRSSSVSSIQPVVSNLIKVYSEAGGSKFPRNDHVASTDKTDELLKVFEQATGRDQPQRLSPALNVKQPSEAREEAVEEFSWDSLVHGTIPVASSIPDQLQSAVENHHYPPEATERPISAASSNHNSNRGHIREMITSIHQQSPERTSTSQQIPIKHIQLNNYQSAISHLHNEDDESVSINHSLNALLSRRRTSRHPSNTDSVHSGTSDSLSRRSPMVQTIHDIQPKLNGVSTYQQQDDDRTTSHRATSVTSLSRRSSERFPPPPPPQNVETSQSSYNSLIKPRAASSLSYRPSINGDRHEETIAPEPKLRGSEIFIPSDGILSTYQRNNSSHVDNISSTAINRKIHDPRQQENYSFPTTTTTTTTTSSLLPSSVITRMDILLLDQKRLEREIDEQIRRLKYDYDDVRKQIDHKQSLIHTEVKTIATRLDDDVTEHFHRKQKIYTDLAADTTVVGTELERLKSNTPNNKQQLWANLEQIENNIRNIRQAVEQHKEPRSALAFTEGHRTIAADTIGQLTSNGFRSSSPHRTAYTSVPIQPEQPITNLAPYKYLKIDHLSTLEPETIAMTENNKNILLGICNKLFILNEYGDTLKTIQLIPSIRGIAISKKHQTRNIAYVSHDEIVSMIDIDSGQTLDCVKETDSTEESGTFLPLGIDTDNIEGNVYVCDYRNSCVIKFDDKLEFITQWRIYNHSNQYDEARPKLISVYGQRLYMIVEHSCKPYYNQGIAYTFSVHICDVISGNIIKIIDAELLSTQRLRWPCSIYAINNEKCYILDTMTSGKYFNGQWQKHWSRVLEIGQDENNIVTELFQLDSEAATMAMTKQTMIISANGEILFVDLAFLQQPNYSH